MLLRDALSRCSSATLSSPIWLAPMTWRQRKLGQSVASQLSMTSTGSMFSSQKHQLGTRSEWRCTERTTRIEQPIAAALGDLRLEALNDLPLLKKLDFACNCFTGSIPEE
ncbi:uncharacterized protein LOC106768809 isoform X2 [Vigna radiata var. radiata]|uniref:Uncharacterized protein LOC106768809 isoform X2 n=1 Tax=Vigna radiata var. radiata TaxID=3916 RepID=A0A1S3UU63_VIGRR|nr:uncharacterized protein LOC106768809 isoform X2 [Vigna radiata var. radiata]